MLHHEGRSMHPGMRHAGRGQHAGATHSGIKGQAGRRAGKQQHRQRACKRDNGGAQRWQGRGYAGRGHGGGGRGRRQYER